MMPDTQIFSQDSQDESQGYLEPTVTVPAWAKLIFLPNAEYNTDLTAGRVTFGRDGSLADLRSQVFVFDDKNCPIRKYNVRISKCHFEIDREEGDFMPAILTCRGVNGLMINDNKLKQGDKQILVHNDIIKLCKGFRMFQFLQCSLPTEWKTLPTECLRKYHIGQQVGSGGCGIVRLVYNVKTLQKSAMKVIAKEVNPMMSKKLVDGHNQKILNEVNIMGSLEHPNVLNLTDWFETKENVVIVMGYMVGRDMLYRITQYDQKRKYLQEANAKFFFLQTCLGIEYLHSKGITHRDIKPDNILLADNTPDALLKISDFGLSKILKSSMNTICGTQLYVAPEILSGETSYTNKVDIWSLGCLLFAMLSGSVPFSDDYKPLNLQTQIKHGKFEFRQKAWSNNKLRDAQRLIRRMLKVNPEERPSIEEVLDDPWLRCQQTISRVRRVTNLDSTLVNGFNETELELTLVNVSLNDSQQSAVPPPLKKRKLE